MNYTKKSIHGNDDNSMWEDGSNPFVFYFPINRHLLLRDYRTNVSMFAALDEQVRTTAVVAALDTIEIVGACSPIGGRDYNIKLALSRCMALRSYLRQEYLAFAETFPIKFSIIGIDSIGYNILKEQNPSFTEKQLWNKLQYAAIRFKMRDGTYSVNPPPPPVETQQQLPRDTIFLKSDTVYIHTTEYIHTKEPAPPRKPLYMALKTNLLYDAVLLPNLSIECYLGNKWSLALEGNWSWWTFDNPVSNRWYHQVQAGGIELRRWFKSPVPLQGHALGVYSMVGDYNLRLFTRDENTMGYSSNLSWSAGLSYAYSFPIARRLNIELGVALGYMGGRYYKYNYCTRHDHWSERGTYDRIYLGPTRLGVSLVWLVGSGHNEKKVID